MNMRSFFDCSKNAISYKAKKNIGDGFLFTGTRPQCLLEWFYSPAVSGSGCLLKFCTKSIKSDESITVTTENAIRMTGI